MREDVHLVAAVVLIGEATRDHSRIDELVATGVLVILIPDRGTDQGLFPDAEGPGRAAWSSDSPQGIEGLLVDLTQHRAFWGGLELTLSERELAMLASLCADPGRARSFADLAEPGGGQYFGDRERALGDQAPSEEARGRRRARDHSVGEWIRVSAVLAGARAS